MKAIHDILLKRRLQGTVLPNGPALYTIEPERWQEYLSKAPTYDYNLDKAKEYMAKSSVPDGFDCKLLTTEASLRYSESLAIQEALKAIKINVELVKLSSDEHTQYQFGGVLDAKGKRDYDMILAGWKLIIRISPAISNPFMIPPAPARRHKLGSLCEIKKWMT